MSRRCAAVCAAALLLSGCGGSNGGDTAYGELSWVEEPLVFAPERLPDDRVLIGRVRNDSLEPLVIEATAVRVEDSAGNPLEGSAQFAAGFAHGLYGAFQQPAPLPPEELARLGRVVRLEAGEESPLSVAFRTDRGTEAPLRIEYGGGALPVPDRVESRRPR